MSDLFNHYFDQALAQYDFGNGANNEALPFLRNAYADRWYNRPDSIDYRSATGGAQHYKAIAEMAQRLAEADTASQLDSFKTQKMQDIASQERAAIDSYKQQAAQMRRQADRALAKPVQAPIAVPTLNPVDPVTDVNTSAALAGGNRATQSFFVNPESTQSRYNITPPLGGGVGARTKRSTDKLVGETDTLGSKRKDEL